jgi:two-component system CheB/CheR fusion protein
MHLRGCPCVGSNQMKKRSARTAAPSAKKPRGKSDNGADSERAAGEASRTRATSTVPGIVGIGASAGGLDAFTRLLHSLPAETGLAYVFVQHLARDYESLLPELLGRATTISVIQARDRMRIEADHAYVIPPDSTMSLADGHLRLVRRPKGRGLHLPIDTFLRSLAEMYGPNAIAVILSGAGGDGSRGVEAIKEAGGIVFTQDSASAAYPQMPEAAVATGCVDFVLLPEEIAGHLAQIGRYFADPSDRSGSGDRPAGHRADEEDLLSVLKLLNRRTGVDFAQYRRGTVQRRTLRRMLVNRSEKPGDYLTLVRNNPAELDLLYQDLLIGVSSFFRDAEVFEELRKVALPELVRSRPPDTPFRVWVAGCSGGEEAYSLAIALIEFLEALAIEAPVQIFGTDLSEAAVTRARIGVYPESIGQQVSSERLRRFFVPDRGSYRIAKFVRDLCIFSRQNIVRDPPFSHLDLISCRNVLIYFEPALQRRVFPVFHYALEPHGMLLLGTAESAGAASELFVPISERHKIYRRRDASSGSHDRDFMSYVASGHALSGHALSGHALSSHAPSAPIVPRMPLVADQVDRSGTDFDAEIDRALLGHFGRRAVIVNPDRVIVGFRGDTTPFLAHKSGSASLDVLELVRPDLVMPLRMALGHAMAERQVARGKHVTATAEGERQVTIEVLPLSAPVDVKQSFLVLFDEEPLNVAALAEPGPETPEDQSTRARSQTEEVQTLREELASAHRYLSELIARHEASIEELRAAGEEIQSSNEELQSTNEELETTKEEVQSTNEELSTVNEELRNRNRELAESASDLANLLSSTTIPIAIVGRDLRLRRFTPATTRVMKVISTDLGRPLSDIKLCFELPNLETLIADSIETLAASRHLVQGDEGMWYTLTIRPYQTIDRRVDGAVLVFADGTEASGERRLLHEAAEKTRAEADRNALLRRLDSAQDDERRRLSRDLHDEVGQHLTALGLGLHGLSNVALPGSEVDLRAEALLTLVGTLGQELHAIALRLRPKVLDDFGLESALSSYVEEWSKQTGIAVDIHAPESKRLPPLIESAVYRVAQEALNNIAKHSAAKRASVTIDRRDGQLHVIIDDNGKGFDYNPLARPAPSRVGLGLLGIRERIALLGGTVEIETTLGRGTTLYIRVPIGGPGGDGRVGEPPGHDDG